MRRLALAAPIAAALLALSCSPPPRDNPFDPADGRIPVVTLDAHVAEGSRATVFSFDAVATGAPGETFVYRWETSRADCSGAAFQSNSTETTAHLDTTLTLTSAMLPAGGVGSVVWNVCVRVSDGPIGAATIAQAPVIVHNHAPVIAPMEDYFVAPTSQPTSFILDGCGQVNASECATTDEDGDPLTFTWVQTGGTDVTASMSTLDATGRRLRFTPGASTNGYRFLLTASDGLSIARRDVFVWSDTVLWYATDSPALLHRVYPEWRETSAYRDTGGTTRTFDNRAMFPDGVALAPNGGYWLSDAYAAKTYLFDSSLKETAAYAISGNSIAAAGSNLCVAGATLSFVKTSGGTVTNLLTSPSTDPENVVVSDGSGGCWSYMQVQPTSGASFELGHVSAAGAYSVIASNIPQPVRSTMQSSLVPAADGGAWLASSDGFAGTPCNGLCRISPNGAVTQVSSYQIDGVMLDPDGVDAIVHFYGALGLWSIAADGVTTELISELPATLQPTAATTDIVSRALWFTDTSGLLYRCVKDDDGTWEPCTSVSADFVTGSSGSSFESLAADPSTSSIFSLIPLPDLTAAVATIPPHMRRMEVLSTPVAPINADVRLSVDAASGQVWYSDGPFAGALGFEKLTADGVAVVGTAGEGGKSFPYEWYHHVTAAPDGTAWAFETDSPQTPNLSLVHLDGATVLQTFPVASGAFGRGLGVGIDGTVCFAYGGVGGLQALGRILPGGMLQTFGANVFNGGYDVDVAVSRDDGCWFAGSQPSGLPFLLLQHYAAASTSPNVSRSETSGSRYGYLAHIVADPRDSTVWVPMVDSTGTAPDYFLERIDTSNALVESFASAAGWTQPVAAIAIRKRCSNASDRNCIDVWQTIGADNAVLTNCQLLRSTGQVDQPLDAVQLGGRPSALSVAP